ncbi:MAG: hypothetical protein MJ246_04220 [Clostridia bacterium]|nr:hypothetical protein [Clostridia bacterium]
MHPNDYSIDIVANFEKDIDTSIKTIVDEFNEHEKSTAEINRDIME